MSRRLPDAPEWSPPDRNLQSFTLRLKLITPMFGGGYETRNVDPITPIRAAAVRGHLRFWWRALYGGQFGSAEELFQRETQLWGSAEKPGLVLVTTAVIKGGNEYTSQGSTSVKDGPKHDWVQWSLNEGGRWKKPPKIIPPWPGYALFPFWGEEPDSTARCRTDVEFRLSVSIGQPATSDADIQEVIQAIAAWVRYGGLGARTRRGCGSLASMDTLQEIQFPSFNIRRSLVTSVRGSRFVLGREVGDPITAWRQAVETYQDFRQKEGYARNSGTERNRPGRSRWPEADAIRRITKRHAPKHSPTNPVQYGFPRADIGLPIIFHFKDSGDPGDTRLEGPATGLSRFASPVITKAFAVDNGKYRPLILVLNAPHSWSFGPLKLFGSNFHREIEQSLIELTPNERRQLPSGDVSIREALLDFAKARWKTSVETLP
jgi:CRISPR-associated protein Cmr1